jgi:hypothetical protein
MSETRRRRARSRIGRDGGNLKNPPAALGRQIEIVIGDDAGKPEEAAVVARRFATRDQVSLAIGSVSTGEPAAAQVFREEEVPQIVVSGPRSASPRKATSGCFAGGAGPQALRHVDFINEKMPNLRFGFFTSTTIGRGFDAHRSARSSA